MGRRSTIAAGRSAGRRPYGGHGDRSRDPGIRGRVRWANVGRALALVAVAAVVWPGRGCAHPRPRCPGARPVAGPPGACAGRAGARRPSRSPRPPREPQPEPARATPSRQPRRRAAQAPPAQEGAHGNDATATAPAAVARSATAPPAPAPWRAPSSGVRCRVARSPRPARSRPGPGTVRRGGARCPRAGRRSSRPGRAP